ncbi:MAG: Npt1/Npt2 family nucleotide transporter, partial [Acidobacteria bacterium]|nr:Npt1/Npt2 family nucleotide transporter [Acidobacteriota bacterium]
PIAIEQVYRLLFQCGTSTTGCYGSFAAKVDRLRLIRWVTLFFISHLAIFYLLGVAGVHIGVAFFLWVGIFNILVIAQFWAFANDVFSEDQGKRLFPMVGVGSSLGAWIGSMTAGRLFDIFEPAQAPYLMMLVAGAVLGVCIIVTQVVNRREALRAAGRQAEAAKPLGKEGGFKLILKQRYLLLIAIFIFLLNGVNTTGEFILGKLVTAQAVAAVGDVADASVRIKQYIGSFYGDFFSWVNLLGFLFQLVLVSRIFKYIGVRGAMFILPCIALGSYGLLIFMPVLGIVRIAKIMENSTDYSIQNTARHALFLPTSREAKYKAKAAIDTFFWRMGDLFQALVVFVGVQLAFEIQHFAMVNVVLVAIWLCVVVAINREHRKISHDTPEPLAKAA